MWSTTSRHESTRLTGFYSAPLVPVVLWKPLNLPTFTARPEVGRMEEIFTESLDFLPIVSEKKTNKKTPTLLFNALKTFLVYEPKTRTQIFNCNDRKNTIFLLLFNVFLIRVFFFFLSFFFLFLYIYIYIYILFIYLFIFFLLWDNLFSVALDPTKGFKND